MRMIRVLAFLAAERMSEKRGEQESQLGVQPSGVE
jgi:hypothetical protein